MSLIFKYIIFTNNFYQLRYSKFDVICKCITYIVKTINSNYIEILKNFVNKQVYKQSFT